MKRYLAALVASAALLGACNDATAVPDLNNVSSETIKGALTTATAQLLTTGLLNQYRNSAIGNYVVFPETMARDALRIDKAETRYLTELIGNVQPDNGAFTGQGVYSGFFVGIRSANTLIDATAAATDASGLDQTQRNALIGLGQTMKALNYWNVMETRDSIGMPIDLDHDINAVPAPWTCKQDVLAYVSSLLDSAATALGAASATFPVKLAGGYSAVAGTPAGFLKFNRGVKAKVELYRGLSRQGGTGAAGFNAAVTALGQSFMQSTDLSTAGLQAGVYENYSTAPGETSNSLVDAALHLNQAVADSVQAGDLRAAKLTKALSPYTISTNGATISTQYDYTFSVGSSSLTHALPILKNEELLLLRAQAAIELNDFATATQYLNFVRVNSGGLAPYAVFASQAAARSALLYEKRYSLLMEGPQRLDDLRAYSLLKSSNFAAGSSNSPFPGDIFTTALPIPINELNARGGTAPLVCP
jgi:starch-binding outer membrane protein, SusD/RagB family